MTTRQLEITKKLLSRANPPSLLYRYRKPSDWTINELIDREIYAATPDELNDPFEYTAPMSIDEEKVKQAFMEYATTKGISKSNAEAEYASCAPMCVQMLYDAIKLIRSDSGVICFSAICDSIQM